MIWLLIGIIASGTFIFSGVSVLTDSQCVSVDLSNSYRAMRMTCREDYLGEISQGGAGWLSILVGIGILVFIFRRLIVVTVKRRIIQFYKKRNTN
jgi:hypothetical protein